MPAADDQQQPQLQQGSCLAISFDGPRTKNGRRLFDLFLEANKACFWNRDLVSAIDALIYMGFMRPGTLFVSAASTAHLAIVRNAYAHRILKPPQGHQLASLGDLGQIQIVPQIRFVPFGDVLCDAISNMNKNRMPATLPAIRDFIVRTSPHVKAPTLEMVQQTAHALLATGLIYQMGEHLFVSMPAQPETAAVCSAECQTGESICPLPDKKRKDKKKLGLLTKLFGRLQTRKHEPQSGAPEPEFLVPQAPPASSGVGHDLQRHLELNYAAAAESKPERRRRATNRRAERRRRYSSQSSSECLDYGPVDPVDCLPKHAEIVDDIASRKKRDRRFKASTPVDTDSALSCSPITTENEDAHDNHRPETHCFRDITHTYVNIEALHKNQESTMFEEFSNTLLDVQSSSPPGLPPRPFIHLISSL